MAAARKKRSTRGKSNRREPRPAGGPVWDPAAVPPEGAAADGPPTKAEEDERAFHATHFSADPRGKGKAGAPPPGAKLPKHRGGTPPP
jgi:hypothetical protein